MSSPPADSDSGTSADPSLETTPVASRPDLEDTDLLPGAQLGRYHVLRRIGAGGMGVVYAAFDPDLDRKVALKVLHPERLDGDSGSRGHARLIREAKAMAKLAHPNVVAVHDVGVFDERVFVAMEFIEGETLTAWLKTRPPWEEVVACMVATGRGLVAAHAQGLVHRDFKPDNVLLGADGRPRVLDFGLARSSTGSSTEPQDRAELEEVSLEVRMRSRDDFGDRITRTGGLTGTPAYMAPEQYLSKQLDARTDQFAFSVVLWEGLHGARPFVGETTAALGLAVCSGQKTPPPANSPIPPRLQRALDKGLSQDPKDRFPSMESLLREIAVEKPHSNRPLWMVLAGATVALGALAAVAEPPTDPCKSGERRIEKVWNPMLAAGLRDKFSGSEAGFARSSAERVTQQLDEYASAWGAEYREACEATHVRREQSAHVLDLRMGCLSQRLRGLRSTVETLRGSDAAVLERAPRAIDALPSIAACEDADNLDTSAHLPEDPSLAETVQEIRERIAGLTAAGQLSRKAPPDAKQVLNDARATGHGPLLAEAQYMSARYAVWEGRHADAVQHLEEAVYAALSSDHDRVLADAFTQLAHATGILLSRYDDGLRWGKHAEAAVSRLGDDTGEAAEYHNVMCQLLADKGDTAPALPHCRRAIELNEKVHGPETLATTFAHHSLGVAYFYAGQPENALTEFEFARDKLVSQLGEEHPSLASVENGIAGVCYNTRPAEACVKAFEAVVRRASASRGDDHPMTTDFRNNLALVELDAGEVESARAHAAQALAARRAHDGDNHPTVAASLRILAKVDMADRDFEAARLKLEEALVIARKTRGNAHRDILSTLGPLSRVATEQARDAAARQYAEDGLKMARTLGDEVKEFEELLAGLDK
ncbi:MAG: protein kinase domain-containing protein [Nannocystales bacterium]